VGDASGSAAGRHPRGRSLRSRCLQIPAALWQAAAGLLEEGSKDLSAAARPVDYVVDARLDLT